MSVENVLVVVNIKTLLKGRFIAHKFSTGWVVGVVKGVEKQQSAAGQFVVNYKSETLDGLRNYTVKIRGRQVLLGVVKE